MLLDPQAHHAVQRAVMDARNASARSRRAHDGARELSRLRAEVARLRRLHATDRSEIARLNRELEALHESLATDAA